MRLRSSALISASIGALVGAGVAVWSSRRGRFAPDAPVRATDTRSADPTLIPMSTVERMMDRFGEVVRETVAAIVNPQNTPPPLVDLEQIRREAERLVDAGVTIPDWAAQNPAQPEYRDPTDLTQPLDNVEMVGDTMMWTGGGIEFPETLWGGGTVSGGNGRAEMIPPGEYPFGDLGLQPPPGFPGANT